jgi:hypothetical protein
MLMATYLPRRLSSGVVSKDPDFVAVCAFAIIGLLITILMAQIFPIDRTIDLHCPAECGQESPLD